VERLDATAPPVVAVMVIHRPDASLDQALAALGAQDYPDLRTLLLVADGDDAVADVRTRAAAYVPEAVVRGLGGNPGWGPACNVALDLVEGDRGFFLLLHDDVALAPDAVKRLVEELYRSNAGIVGPKLVEWDDPRRLHRVGLGVDRIGEIDPLVEPGELDQEQHDAVRDMFALPSACLLIRADLLRLLRFDDDIDFHGDDVDLCWRAHLTGARVLLVPAASARHRGRLPERRPDLAHRALMARHRAWSVATLTGARRLPGVLIRLIAVTLAELVAGLVTGRARQSWSMLVAVAGLGPRLPRVVARRRRIRPLRLVPENEVAYLQMRGSARLQRYRRTRQSAVAQRRRDDAAIRGLEPARHPVSLITWAVVIGFVLVGSRRLLLDGVAPIGEMLPLSDKPGELLRSYAAPWWGQGVGGPDAAPTGVALTGLAGVIAATRTGLVHTLTTVGLLVVGLAGLWRLGARLHSEVGRRACVLGGLIVPFGVGALAAGRWSALLIWAVTPWWMDAIVGAGDDDAPRRRRRGAAMVVATAIVAAFVPAALVVLLFLAVVLGLATVWTNVGAAWRGVRHGAGVVVGAALLNLPWSWSFVSGDVWRDLMTSGSAGSANLGWWVLAQWGRSGVALAGLSALVLVPAVAVAVLARGERAVWGLRAAFVVGGFAAVVVVIDRRLIGFEVGDLWWWMGPVAVGAALAIGTLAAAWRSDVVTRSFGWRQPLGLVAAAAVALASLAPLLGAVDGRWNQPRTSLPVLLGQLPTNDAAGDHRVVFIGDARVVPVATRPLGEGLGYAVVDGGALTATTSRWLPAPTAADRAVHDAFEAVSQHATPRLGRLLAPLGVRYIVVPLIDGVASTPNDPLPAPVGLLDRLGRQLDVRRRSGTAELVIFENEAWIPTRAVLRGATAAGSQQAGQEALVDSDPSDRRPVLVGADLVSRAVTTIVSEPDAVFHLGVPRSAGWQLEVDGRAVPSRSSFGMVTAWDLPGSGSVRVELIPPRDVRRWVVVAGQALAWMAVIAVAAGSWPRRRHRSLAPVHAPIVHLGDPE
jgi:GT2 family glycosyltransferase